MRICRECAHNLPDGAKFCSRCGAKQHAFSAPKNLPAPYASVENVIEKISNDILQFSLDVGTLSMSINTDCVGVMAELLDRIMESFDMSELTFTAADAQKFLHRAHDHARQADDLIEKKYNMFAACNFCLERAGCECLDLHALFPQKIDMDAMCHKLAELDRNILAARDESEKDTAIAKFFEFSHEAITQTYEACGKFLENVSVLAEEAMQRLKECQG